MSILEELEQRDLLHDFTAIAKRYHVTLDELMGHRGKRAAACICEARRACWALLRGIGWSYPTIAKLWGMDHTSVIHGVRKAQRDSVMKALRGAA